jgi:hypothetical protein
MKCSPVAAISITGIEFGSVAAVFADATPTIKGGNGAGQNGRSTGPAADRPEQQIRN